MQSLVSHEHENEVLSAAQVVLSWRGDLNCERVQNRGNGGQLSQSPPRGSALHVAAWPSSGPVLAFLPHLADTAEIWLVEAKYNKQDSGGMAP